MPSAVNYFMAYLVGSLGAAPIGWPWNYLAENTNGKDPVSGYTAQEYRERAESYNMRNRNPVWWPGAFMVKMTKWAVYDLWRTLYWMVKSLFI